MKWMFWVWTCCAALPVWGQKINPERITIVRDEYGVPYIYAPTDAEAAYGLIYAVCEDDFGSMVETFANVRGKLGSIKGKDGVLLDFFLYFTGIDTLVEARYEKDLSPDFRRLVEAATQAANDYAAAHPDQVPRKDLFPVRPQDFIKGYCLSLSLMAGTGMAFKMIREGKIREFLEPNEGGSNAMAISARRSDDGATRLLINSHQPMEGRFAWYEAQVHSDEGWQFHGGLFPGGVTLFIGVNPFIGWAHTNNYNVWGDIYKLKTKGKKYFYDGQWRKFQTRTAPLRLKLFGKVALPIRKKIYACEYGPIYRRKGTHYALRFPANTDIRAAEQWYRMNKARTLQEFKNALKMEALPMFNVVYADGEDNIFYISEGKYPLREPGVNWTNPIDGTSSQTKWTKLVPWEQKPIIENPECGYVYSVNQTPLHTTCSQENWNRPFCGLQLFEYNRGDRYMEMFAELDGRPISRADFLRIKFDPSYSRKGRYARNYAALYRLNPQKYPRLAYAIQKLKRWNRRGDADNKDAALALVTHYFLEKITQTSLALQMILNDTVTEREAVKALSKARRFLLKYHKTLDVPLGEVQRHRRGTVDLPIDGMLEVSRAIHVGRQKPKKGRFRAHGGDCFIMYSTWDAKRRQILETVNCYGASARPESPHYTDQMHLFVNHQMRSVTFDKQVTLKRAEKVYRPGQ
jgi:acyl-homoserine-lactone acylase